VVTCRASYYFVTKDNEGWSENLYGSGTDLPTLATKFSAYIALRMALSPNNVDMVYAKVSDVEVKGDSLIIPVSGGNYPVVGTWTETPTGAFLEANTALLIELLAGSTKKNRVFIRGLSLDIVTGREFMNPTAFTTALTAVTTWYASNTQVRQQVVPHETPPRYTYQDCDNSYFKAVTARKPGRPFVLPRGRKFAHRA
jgi:hypothetical protein